MCGFALFVVVDYRATAWMVMFMNKPSIFHDRLAPVSICDGEMIILVIAFIHSFLADCAFTLCTLVNLSLLFLIESALWIESNAYVAINLFTPEAIMLCDSWPRC